MDFLGHPKALTRLWAALMSDYEVVISNFLRSKGWTFSHFADAAKKMDINLVYHCAVGKGKRRQDQYDEVVKVILETAKDYWLSADRPKYVESSVPTEKSFIVKEEPLDVPVETTADDIDIFMEISAPPAKGNGLAEPSTSETLNLDPWPTSDTQAQVPSTSSAERIRIKDLVSVKRQLGGFFLTYLLYFKQPYDGLHRILIDPEDFEAIKRFEARVQQLTTKIRDQYDFMIFRMKLNHGFEIMAFSNRFGLDHSTRTYLNGKTNEIVDLIKADKEIQDKLTQCQDVHTGQKKFQRYFEQKRIVLNESLLSVLSQACPAEIPIDFPDDSHAVRDLVPSLRSTDGVQKMVEAASNIKLLGTTPLFTHANLLGNESVDRIFMKEANKRIKRMQVKQEKGNIQDKKTLNPYVREGGIFGRKKEFDEGEKEMRRKKERAQTSGNLWNYISGADFNRGRPPAPASGPTGDQGENVADTSTV